MINNVENLKDESICEEFYDYDNFDSVEIEENFVEPKVNLDKTIEYSCDKCNYKTKSNIHHKVHVKSCHKIIELNEEQKLVTKKRKNTDDNASTRKKPKSADVVSKKEGKYSCDECNYKTQSKKSLKKHKETSCEATLD